MECNWRIESSLGIGWVILLFRVWLVWWHCRINTICRCWFLSIRTVLVTKCWQTRMIQWWSVRHEIFQIVPIFFNLFQFFSLWHKCSQTLRKKCSKTLRSRSHGTTGQNQRKNPARQRENVDWRSVRCYVFLNLFIAKLSYNSHNV